MLKSNVDNFNCFSLRCADESGNSNPEWSVNNNTRWKIRHKNNFSLGLKISIIFILLCKVPRGWACKYQAHGRWIYCDRHSLVKGMKACDQTYLLMDKSFWWTFSYAICQKLQDFFYSIWAVLLFPMLCIVLQVSHAFML